jgi:hypothetical protein
LTSPTFYLISSFDAQSPELTESSDALLHKPYKRAAVHHRRSRR